ncbi:unnamed protein product [Rangifer tarandus platyrhynchus]|uniref:Uncharacterized protein n=1 Tax=Rangifer tarandus platyrhynchus TaxID=3082113 RepID=A0ABN8Y2M7_RANTA|nr:unnamed protein product [Rangifer tarandus platyrhynchus]
MGEDEPFKFNDMATALGLEARFGGGGPLRPLAPAFSSILTLKPKENRSLQTRASGSRTYREDPRAVASSLPARPHSKRRERTGPCLPSPQLREW